MTTLMARLRDKVASITDPLARSLRGEALENLLRERPTSWALEALRDTNALSREIAERMDATHKAVALRKEAEVAAAYDRGVAPPQQDSSVVEPEWQATLDRLATIASELGLAHRGHISVHLSARRHTLTACLRERYAIEGEPGELVELRKKLSAQIALHWQQLRRTNALRDERRGLPSNEGRDAHDAEIVASVEASNESNAEQTRIRALIADEWGAFVAPYSQFSAS
jgi:hypothetical protein